MNSPRRNALPYTKRAGSTAGGWSRRSARHRINHASLGTGAAHSDKRAARNAYKHGNLAWAVVSIRYGLDVYSVQLDLDARYADTCLERRTYGTQGRTTSATDRRTGREPAQRERQDHPSLDRGGADPLRRAAERRLPDPAGRPARLASRQLRPCVGVQGARRAPPGRERRAGSLGRHRVRLTQTHRPAGLRWRAGCHSSSRHERLPTRDAEPFRVDPKVLRAAGVRGGLL